MYSRKILSYISFAIKYHFVKISEVEGSIQEFLTSTIDEAAWSV